MCELFGFCGSQPEKLNQELREFFSHSAAHPNGWGLALLDGDAPTIEKEPVQASKSRYLKARLQSPVLAKTALAHIRYATIGSEAWCNCHPYTGVDGSGRHWTLIHNGTIFDYPPMEHYTSLQQGDTDSERILLYLIDQMDLRTQVLGHPLGAEERFQVLDTLVTSLSPENKLNLLIYDGELLYAHTNYADSLHVRQTEQGAFFSTQPLALGTWQPLPMTTLVAYQEGVLRFTGTDHGHAYIPDEERVKLLYLAFADL
jgi:glutamine amidotransferase